jgi:hypothetical protein
MFVEEPFWIGVGLCFFIEFIALLLCNVEVKLLKCYCVLLCSLRSL